MCIVLSCHIQPYGLACLVSYPQVTRIAYLTKPSFFRDSHNRSIRRSFSMEEVQYVEIENSEASAADTKVEIDTGKPEAKIEI